MTFLKHLNAFSNITENKCTRAFTLIKYLVPNNDLFTVINHFFLNRLNNNNNNKKLITIRFCN